MFLPHWLSPSTFLSQFTEKAPPEVVAKVRQQAEEAEEKLALLAARLAGLEGL